MINLIKCILPAIVSIEYLIDVIKIADSNTNSKEMFQFTRIVCVTDFRAATLTTVYFFHGFVLAWIAIERLSTIRNPLRSATTIGTHLAIISGFAVLAIGIYLACFIDAKAHDPEPGPPNCALEGLLGRRLMYPIMSIRVFALIVGFICYPFIIHGLLNLKKWQKKKNIKVKKQNQIYQISVTI
uniref:G-protein coupled receptors family 1 profile domain-containing protein n=1 Tax=Panagrolaimus sp. JU765 TaxID=591449 RepID=A0AC34RCW7_9BILA